MIARFFLALRIFREIYRFTPEIMPPVWTEADRKWLEASLSQPPGFKFRVMLANLGNNAAVRACRAGAVDARWHAGFAMGLRSVLSALRLYSENVTAGLGPTPEETNADAPLEADALRESLTP